MAFDKKTYWKRRNNTESVVDPKTDEKTEVRKPLRGQGDYLVPSLVKKSDVQIGFGLDGQMIVQNRAYRRRRYSLPTDLVKKKIERKHRDGKKNPAGQGLGRK